MKKLTLLVLIVLTAASGTYAITWVKTFGGTDIDWGSCVQQTSDGGYIVTGFTYSFGTPGVGDIWLIKLDSLGGTEWTKTYGEGGGSSVWQTSDGGYVIGGSKLIRTDESGDTIWTRAWAGIAQPTSDGGYIILAQKLDAVCLLKLNENADSVWARLYPKIGSYGDLPSWVEQTSDGGYIITGLADDVDTVNMVEKTALFLLKADSGGNTQWLKTYGGKNWNDLDRGRCVRQTSDGGYIVTGTFVAEGKLYSLLRTDANGDSLWKSIRGGEFYCVEETKDGGFIIAGATEWATLSLSLGNGDLWLFKTKANGDSVWARKYGGDELDAGRYVKQTTDGGYVVVGYTGSYGAGGYDLYLLKTDSVGLLTVKEELGNDHLRNWQVVTPVGREVLVRFADFSNGFEASIFDASGRQVVKLQNHSPSGILSWGSDYPSGVYFIQVREQNLTSTSKIVLVK
jgi:hypothetical protein